MTPFCIWTWAWRRSFQIVGTSVWAALDSCAMFSMAWSTSMPASIMNLANTDAFASSRRWKMTLFLSAMSSKLCVKESAYLTKGWPCLDILASTNFPLASMVCSRASTPIFTKGTMTLSSVNMTSAFRTTNHSRAFHSWKFPASPMSKALFMPITGCSCSPMESSFKYTSAWNITSPTLVPANQSGSKRFAKRLLSLPAGSREKSGSLPVDSRTLKASERYSKFTAAAGSMVGATRTLKQSSFDMSITRQHMPGSLRSQPRMLACSMFRGIRSNFQPMSCSMWQSNFMRASRFRRDSSSFLAAVSKIFALHSA
mmetsp:Transcript_84917/g.181971  ORF Transcript_84917/g.181971 Transcript_84917/m.181971 type:complete len:313 (-) Transcript_84917:272-1210(-)